MPSQRMRGVGNPRAAQIQHPPRPITLPARRPPTPIPASKSRAKPDASQEEQHCSRGASPPARASALALEAEEDAAPRPHEERAPVGAERARLRLIAARREVDPVERVPA